MKNSLFGIYQPAHKAALLIADVILIWLSFSVASLLRLGVFPDFLSIEYIGLNIIILASLFLGNGYTSGNLRRKPKLPLNTFFVTLAASIPCTLYIYLLGPERFTALFGRGVFPASLFSLGVLAVLSRFVINFIFRENSKTKKALILGDIKSKNRFNSTIENIHLNVNVEYTKTIDEKRNTAGIDIVVITPDHKLSECEQQTLTKLRLNGIPIYSLPEFFESFAFIVPVQEINNDWFIRTQGFSMLHSSVTLRIKRALDIVFSSILLFCSTPIIFMTILVIKASSPGPIFFSQTRVGFKGKEFVIHKFRTMKMGAEDHSEVWAQENDPRIIRFGNFLRKTRIDELPQCWNILKGEMSLVGPRPERPNFTKNLGEKIPYYGLRHIVKPGLTGWAQVSYPYGASIEDALRKLQYDLYYIKNYSLILDLNILLRTILVTLRRSGR